MPGPVIRPPGRGSPEARERGSVLFLVPVGLLIVVLLGAVAVDLGNVWLQQRRLADAADAAANDAATYGIDIGLLRAEGVVELDRTRTEAAARHSVAGQLLPAGATIVTIDPFAVSAEGNPAVTVVIESQAELIFGRLVRNEGIAIRAAGTAELVDGLP